MQRALLNVIKWQPSLHGVETGVAAKDGVVILTGVVDIYFKKSAAENAAKNLIGVKAVAEETEVKCSGSIYIKNDTEIAYEVRMP